MGDLSALVGMWLIFAPRLSTEGVIPRGSALRVLLGVHVVVLAAELLVEAVPCLTVLLTCCFMQLCLLNELFNAFASSNSMVGKCLRQN